MAGTRKLAQVSGISPGSRVALNCRSAERARKIGAENLHLGKWPTLGRSDPGNLADHSLYAVHEKRRAGLPHAGVGPRDGRGGDGGGGACGSLGPVRGVVVQGLGPMHPLTSRTTSRAIAHRAGQAGAVLREAKIRRSTEAQCRLGC